MRLTGRITIDSSPQLRKTLLQHIQSTECSTLTLDFEDVPYIDTSGLATLLEVLRAARKRGKTLRLSGLHERPRFVLEASRLLRLFDGASS